MPLFNWFQKVSATVRTMSLYLPLNQGWTGTRNYEKMAREGYTQNSVLYACIRELAEASASVPWTLFRKRADGQREELRDHALLKLIERPNPIQGRFEFVESSLAYLYLSGNLYIEAVGPGEGDAGVSAQPRELYPLRPDRMTILPDPVHLIGGYEYQAAGETVRFSKDRIFHLKLFNPLDDWYGLSPVQVAALAIDKMNVGDQWNAALLQNAAVPSGALISKQRLTDDQFHRLEQEMRDNYQGALNARKPLLLEGDLDWKELSVSPKDMDWVEGLKLSAMQIAQIYNVPPELIGLQTATFQNRKEARKALYTEVVLPALKRLRDGFNNWLTPRFGRDLLLDLDTDRVEALSEDRELVWRRARESHFLTLNEKRQLVGYGPVPGGDALIPPDTRGDNE